MILYIFHYNIQGALNKLDDLDLFLSKFRTENKILLLTEHWLDADNSEYLNNSGLVFVTGYCREVGERGGSAILVSKSFLNNVKILPEFEKLAMKHVFEISAIELNMYSTTFLIVCIYRIPDINNFDLFCSQLEILLNSIRKSKKYGKSKIILGGDLNVNTLIDNKYCKTLLDIISSYGLRPNFNKPTRIAKTSETCIDNIFTSFSVENPKIIEPGLSDHTAQLIHVTCTSSSLSYKTCTRNFSEDSIKRFVYRLGQEDWQPLYEIKDNNNSNEFVNNLYKQFLQIFTLNFNLEFPKKTAHSSKKHSKKKWLTDEIITLSSNKRDLFKLTKITSGNQNAVHVQQYRDCKNSLKRIVCQAKLDYNNKAIQESENISKASWNIVNSELGKNHLKNSKVQISTSEGLSSNTEAADLLNNHYLTIIERLKLKPNSIEALAYTKNYINNASESLFLGPVTSDEILSAIKRIKNKKSCGWDEIPMFLIKRVGVVLAPHLTYIFNNCLTSGIFPDLLKYSVIKPIQKNSGKGLDDFRPISLLPIFSNLLERIILNRLLPHLDKQNIINKEQFGFQKNLSTIDAVTSFTNHIFNYFDHRIPAASIFCDLSKAFDVMNRQILLQKMEHYGIRGTANNILDSYFENRYQQVQINDQGKYFKSDWKKNEVGCPQGSILGPVLFLIFVADLAHNVNSTVSNTVQYADDTSVIVKGENQNDLDINLVETLNKLNLWFTTNGLKLNENKTQVIKFKQRQTIENKNEISCTKFLGVIVDEKLDFSFHINALSKKMNSACFKLKILSTCINFNTLKKVYYANIQSILNYGLTIWGSTTMENFNRIFTIQKRAMRIIYGVPPFEPCQNLFKNAKVMTLASLYIFGLCNFFLKNKDSFIFSSHRHNTRNNFIPYPTHFTTKFEKSTYYMVCKIVNKFLSLDKEVIFNKIYITKIKTYLIENAFYSVEDFLSCTRPVLSNMFCNE